MDSPQVLDYSHFRLRLLNTPQYSHMKLLLYWPVFGLLFAFLERVGVTDVYTTVHIPLDDLIPFCEWFVFPYLFWFVFLIGMLAYTFFRDVGSFRQMMWFIILTYTVTIVIYILFPTCQELRPARFPRDNMLTRFMAWFYTFDTSTNVCPSIHVIGAVASLAAGWHTKRFGTAVWRAVFTGITVLICLSTVFLKQHSALDVFTALPLCAGGWWLVYGSRWAKKFAAPR